VANEQYTLQDVVDAGIENRLNTLRVSTPAKIISYDSSTQSATISLSIRASNFGEIQEEVQIPDVPVSFPRVGDSGMSYMLKSGDSVLCVFSDRDLDLWRVSGEGNPPVVNAKFDINNAIVIAGISPDADQFSQKEATEIVGDKLFIGKPSEEASSLTAQTPAVLDAITPPAPITPADAAAQPLSQPGTSATAKTYQKGNMDLISILIHLVDNLSNAGYGGDTLFSGGSGAPVTAFGSRIGQMDENTIENLGKIVEDLKKLKSE